MDFSLNHASETNDFEVMMENLKNLESPFFDLFDKEVTNGPKICQVIKAADWRPVLVAALINILKDNSIATILQLQENLSLKNSWLLNFWLKSANLITMDLIQRLR